MGGACVLPPPLFTQFHPSPACQPILYIRCFNRKAYNKAVKASNLVDFTFHDLRHCAINNLRLAGNDHFVIKRALGHKTDSAFQRYNLVTEEEMKGMKWLDEKEEKSGTMDTYMDTMLKLKRT